MPYTTDLFGEFDDSGVLLGFRQGSRSAPIKYLTDFGSGASAPVALIDGATITPDAASGVNQQFYVTLGGNRTLANALNPVAGAYLEIEATQDGNGSRQLSAWGNEYKWALGVAPVLSTAPGARDRIGFRRNAANTAWDQVLYSKSLS